MVLSPSTSTSLQLSGQRGLVKQKEDSSSCLQPCLPPPGSAEHPAWPALPQVRPQRQSLRSPRPPPVPPTPYPRATASACSPRARRVSPAPAAAALL